MKKQVLVIAACVAVLSACSSGDPNHFTVSGKLDHAKSKMAFLEQIAYDNNDVKKIDSSKIADDGSYSMKGVAKEEGLYLITVDSVPAAIFINDAGNIKISADVSSSNYKDPYISNSDATKTLYGFLNDFRVKDSSLGVLYNQMMRLYQVNPMDSGILALQQQGNKIALDIKNITKNYIESTKHPAAAYYAMTVAGSRNIMSLPEIDSLAEKTSAKFKDHAGLALFKSMLKQESAQSADPSEATYPLLNQQAPDLTMNDVNGNPISISSLKGKYVLVDFWASWCRPCREENPNVVAAYNKYKGKNFQILGVSLDKDKAEWQKAIKNDGLTWLQMSDLQEWQSAAVNAYQIDGIPFNVLLDPSGKIIASSLRGPALDQKLSEVLQ